MNKEFIQYQQALALKELGFNEECFGNYKKTHKELEKAFYCYNSDYFDYSELYIAAPLYQQAFHWLLEKHNLYGIIIPTVTMAWTFKTMTTVTGMVEVPPYSHVDAGDYSSREEAEQACLEKLIELVKNK